MFLSGLFEKRESISNPSQEFVDFMGGGVTTSGKSVSEETALTYSAVFACVNVISETLASLPLFLYGKKKGAKEKARDHPLYELLHDMPNEEMTSMTFRQTLQVHLLLRGNCYAEIEWGPNGFPRALWPLNAASTWPERDKITKKIVYKTIINGQGYTLPAERVLHITGLSLNGRHGLSPIGLMRETIGLGMAAEEYGARFFSNGAKPGGVLEHPGNLSDPAKKSLVKSWNDMHRGLENQHRIAVLEEGLTYKQVGIPPEDAQFLETRKFQVSEVARIYRVPPHMIADLEKATFSNIEHQGIEFVSHTMRPWLVRWEQTLRWKLMTKTEKKKYNAEFNVEGLLRGDTKSRYDAYHMALNDGWMSGNEVRKLENLEEKPELDEHLINGNFTLVKAVLKTIEDLKKGGEELE